jgi:hypothetical protein
VEIASANRGICPMLGLGAVDFYEALVVFHIILEALPVLLLKDFGISDVLVSSCALNCFCPVVGF